MVEINNRDGLREWLEGKPKEWSVAIACRVALRTVPELSRAIACSTQENTPTRIVLPVFRAMILQLAMAKYSARGEDLWRVADAAANSVSAAAISVSVTPDNSVNAAVFTAFAAVAHSISAATATDTVSAAAGVAVFAAGAANADVNAADAVVWKWGGEDAAALESGIAPEMLVAQPLWQSADWLEKQWFELRNHLQKLGGDWDVWVNWYEDRLAGRNTAGLPDDLAEGLDLKIARQDNEWWERDATEVNADIKVWIAEARLNAAIVNSLGANWVENQIGQLEPKLEIEASDAEISQEEICKQLHTGIKRRIDDFEQQAQEIEDILGWDGFNSSYERVKNATNRETTEIPEALGEVYETSLDFAKYLEQDNWIRKEGGGNVTPLDPTRRRAFEGIVELLAPWIRRFPTARSLDDELGAFMGKMPDLMLANQIALVANETNLISNKDRALIQSLIKAFEGNGAIAAKAANRGALNLKSLTYKAAAIVIAFYSGSVSSDFAGKSLLVSHASDFLATSERQILEHLEGVPADIRQAVQSAIRRSKESKDNTDDISAGIMPDAPKRPKLNGDS